MFIFQLQNLVSCLEVIAFGFSDGSFAFSNLALELADAFEGRLIGFAFEEGLSGDRVEFLLHAIAGEQTLFNSFLEVFAFLGCFIVSSAFLLQPQIVSVEVLQFLDQSVLVSLILLEDGLLNPQAVHQLLNSRLLHGNL